MKHLLCTTLVLACCASSAARADTKPEAVAHELAHAAAPAPDAGPAPPAVAPAAPPAVDPERDPGAFVHELEKAAKTKNWPLLTALLVTGIVLVLRKVGVRYLPWIGTDRGGATLAMITGLAAALVAVFGAGGKPTGQTVFDGFGAALLSTIAYQWLKQMLWPKDAKAKP